MRRTERPLHPATTIENAWSVHLLKAKDPRIQHAVRLLQQCRAIEVDEIASSLNLSKSRFRHLFRDELGISPRGCLRLVRLARAKELLETSFLRVKEITTLVGVNDVSHFVRDYKVFYKQTPSQTRALCARGVRTIPAGSHRGQ